MDNNIIGQWHTTYTSNTLLDLERTVIFLHSWPVPQEYHTAYTSNTLSVDYEQTVNFVRAWPVPLGGNICLLDVNQPTIHENEEMTTKLDSI